MLHIGFLHQGLVQSISKGLELLDRTISFVHVCKVERLSVPIHEIIIFNITMLHFVLFHNVTCYTFFLLSHIHVNSTDFRNITYTLVATSVILWSLAFNNKLVREEDNLGERVRNLAPTEGRNPNALHSSTKEATHFRHRHFAHPPHVCLTLSAPFRSKL